MAERPRSTKKKPGRPKGRSPVYVLHTNIDPEIGKAFEAYIEAQRFQPTQREVVELALITFLEKEQAWKPKAPPPPKE